MSLNERSFNHLKVHTQYSICEGAVKIDDLQDFSKLNKIKSLALCDTSNLCGALEFAEKISKVGTQPIIGTQINFKFGDTVGLIPLFALNEDGYKTIIKLSSLSFLKNDELSDPHLDLNELFNNKIDIVASGGVSNSNEVTSLTKLGAKSVQIWTSLIYHNDILICLLFHLLLEF